MWLLMFGTFLWHILHSVQGSCRFRWFLNICLVLLICPQPQTKTSNFKWLRMWILMPLLLPDDFGHKSQKWESFVGCRYRKWFLNICRSLNEDPHWSQMKGPSLITFAKKRQHEVNKPEICDCKTYSLFLIFRELPSVSFSSGLLGLNDLRMSAGKQGKSRFHFCDFFDGVENCSENRK